MWYDRIRGWVGSLLRVWARARVPLLRRALLASYTRLSARLMLVSYTRLSRVKKNSPKEKGREGGGGGGWGRDCYF